jgi:hypothetical protein
MIHDPPSFGIICELNPGNYTASARTGRASPLDLEMGIFSQRAEENWQMRGYSDDEVGLDPRIIFAVPEKAKYLIWLRDLSDASGDFELTIERER